MFGEARVCHVDMYFGIWFLCHSNTKIKGNHMWSYSKTQLETKPNRRLSPAQSKSRIQVQTAAWSSHEEYK